MKRISIAVALIAAATAGRAAAAHADRLDEEFVKARNTEIEASMAAYETHRAILFTVSRNSEIGISVAAYLTRRNAEFIAARNAEIVASVARAEFVAARNREIEISSVTAAALREREFVKARNQEIWASMAATGFAKARNAEIEASVAAVARQRTLEFVVARNAEIEASTSAVASLRIEVAARNAEIERSVAAVETARLEEFTIARNDEIGASLAAVDAIRTSEFAAARNLEIDIIVAAHTARRHPEIITGTLASPAESGTPGAEACRSMASSVGSVRFASASAELDEAGKAALYEIARVAATCTGLEIEVHGHSDAAGSERANRRLAERRARRAADYLAEAGIDMRRLRSISHGAASPVAPNDTDANRALNRRIEFTLREPAAARADLPASGITR